MTSKQRHYPGLDGIKGFALIAIVTYHVAQSSLPGGFYGVDVFLTVSGFVIALSLLRSLARNGTPDLAGYIPRRAVRLYPAMLLLVPSAVSLGWLVDRDALVGIRDQVITTLLGCYNWYAIVNGQDYFNQMNPQMLRHLWFVGVLIQFYMVVPFIVWLMWLLRRTHLAVLIPLALAAASGWSMWTRYGSAADATRVYFGTDTHAVGLMLGVALAWIVAALHRETDHADDGRSGAERRRTAHSTHTARATAAARRTREIASAGMAAAKIPSQVMPSPAMSQRPAPPYPASLPPSVPLSQRPVIRNAGAIRTDVPDSPLPGASLGMTMSNRFMHLLAPIVSFACLASLISMAVWGRQDASAFHGGIILASILSAALIAGTIASGSWMRDLMVFRPLAALGKYSYGIYLWHWPLWVIVSAALPRMAPGIDRRWAFAVTAACTAAASVFSWIMVEKPAARHSFLFVVLPFHDADATHILRAVVVDLLAVAVTFGCVTGIVNAPEKTSMQIQLEEQARELARMEREQRLAGELPRGAVPQPRQVREMPTGDQMTAIGDSVMLASSSGLNATFPGISIDASVSRSLLVAPGIMRTQMASGALRKWVILGLGTNTAMTTAQLQRVYELIGPDQMLLLVNAHGDRPWIPSTNKVMADFAAAHPDNVLLVDWDAAVKAEPGVLGSDGIHPNKGTDLYARAIKTTLERWVAAGR